MRGDTRDRGWWLIAVVALLVGAVAGCDRDDAAEVDERFDWSRDDADELLPARAGGEYADLLADPAGGWLLAGAEYRIDGRAVPAVWSSDDGLEWQADHLDLDDDLAAAGVRLRAAAASGERVVAVGSVGRRSLGPAAVWVRDGDGDFELVDADGLDRDGGLRAIDLTATDDGLLLLAAGVDGRLALRSDDGVAWEPVDALNDALAEATAPDAVASASGPGGTVVLTRERVEGVHRAVLWHSSDGRAWQRAAELAGDDVVVAGDVDAAGEGFVAVGGERVGGMFEPRLWTSPDGESWRAGDAEFPEPDVGLLDPRGTDLTAVARDGDEWVVAGTRAAASYLWRSSDLTDWTPLDLPGATGGPDAPDYGLLAAADGAALAASADTRSQPAVLHIDGEDVRELGADDGGGLASAAHRTVVGGMTDDGERALLYGHRDRPRGAVGSGDQVSAIWYGDDGRWRAGGARALRDAVVTDVIAVEDGLLAVGHDQFVERVTDEREVRGWLWRSDDGADWERVDVEAFAAEVTSRVLAAAAFGDTVVALGHGLDAHDLRLMPWAWARIDGEWEAAADPLVGEDAEAVVEVACALEEHAVALGELLGPGPRRVAVWTSDDAHGWEPVADAEPFAAESGARVSACVASDEKLTAVGWRNDGEGPRPAAWVSDDGLAWEAVDAGAFAEAAEAELADVADDGEGTLYAVGSVDEDGQTAPAVWQRPAGEDWRRVGLPPEPFVEVGAGGLSAVTVVGGEVVIAGELDHGAAVWRSPLP